MHVCHPYRLRVRLLLLALLTGVAAAVHAQVKVLTGPTPIPRGSARAAGDITVVNEKLAFALAVESSAPYGVPRGALVDLAPVRAGQIQRSRVVFADFIPNNWSAWPNTYHHVEILERGPERVVIRATRDFGAVTVSTRYTLARGSDRIEIVTTMTNTGRQALPGLLSGLTLWPNSGFLFAVPGLAGITEGPAAGALADRVVAYDADWSVTLYAPYLDHIGSDSRDLLKLHTLAPGETHTFAGTLQVGTRGDLAPVVAAEIATRQLPAGGVSGSVRTAAGAAVPEPVVVVEQDGKPYAWTLGQRGHYAIALPQGRYDLYATGRGDSESRRVPVTVKDGSAAQCDFTDLRPPGQAAFTVKEVRSGTPLDARLVISAGQKPLVGFLGRTTFFTELKRRGYAHLELAPGHYVFAVSSGGAFLGPPAQQPVQVASGSVSDVRVQLSREFDPPARGWYSADLHHHADQAEAVTPPEDLARSQLAAGLNLLFVSDHDATVNNAPLAAIAAARGVPFIAGIELSPSWGHFNAYPLKPAATLNVDTSTASIQQILAEARREGASIVQVNHPFIPFGYFTSVAAGTAPGGFDGDFDLIEINSSVPQDDHKVLERAWSYWNQAQHYYLSAGSDTHDVWNQESGRVRVFVHPDGALSTASFVAALKAGHAYVSYGPLIFPAAMFGATLKANEAARLSFDLGAVSGLKEVQLIGAGETRDTRTFSGGPHSAHVDFTLPAAHAAWYALEVEDQEGHNAYTNPIWMMPP
jgi:Carboxypeptidase regulatory-like domain